MLIVLKMKKKNEKWSKLNCVMQSSLKGFCKKARKLRYKTFFLSITKARKGYHSHLYTGIPNNSFQNG